MGVLSGHISHGTPQGGVPCVAYVPHIAYSHSLSYLLPFFPLCIAPKGLLSEPFYGLLPFHKGFLKQCFLGQVPCPERSPFGAIFFIVLVLGIVLETFSTLLGPVR